MDFWQMLTELIITISTITGICIKVINFNFAKIHKRLDKSDRENSKNYLTEFLADVKNGVKKDENQIARANEVYDYYLSLKGNSYVQGAWEELMKKRK
jgi:hypothetical protein